MWARYQTSIENRHTIGADILRGLSPVKVFELLFDVEGLDPTTARSSIYAGQTKGTTITNFLPDIISYLLRGVPIVSDCTPRRRFLEIKDIYLLLLIKYLN